MKVILLLLVSVILAHVKAQIQGNDDIPPLVGNDDTPSSLWGNDDKPPSDGVCLFQPDSEGVVNIPAGTTVIATKAFWGCWALITVNIPMSVVSIGDEAFSDIKYLQFVNFEAGSVLHDIGASAFYGAGILHEITLPPGLKIIYDRAFDRTGLFGINIPSSVVSIGSHCFYDCVNFGGMGAQNPDLNAATFEFSDIPLVVGASAFAMTPYQPVDTAFPYVCSTSACRKIIKAITCNDVDNSGNVVIPEGITEITSKAFHFCETVQKVSISSTVTSIGDRAFDGCSYLNTVTITSGSQLVSIGDYAFANDGSLMSFPMPEGVRTIGVMAFEYNKLLNNIHLPSSLVKISSQAFKYCKALTSLTFGCDNSQTLIIGQNAFEDTPWADKETPVSSCRTVEHSMTCDDVNPVGVLDIPAGTEVIPTGAYRECADLKTVNLAESVISIQSFAFYKSWNLETVNFLGECKARVAIGNDAFTNTSQKLSLALGPCSDCSNCGVVPIKMANCDAVCHAEKPPTLFPTHAPSGDRTPTGDGTDISGAGKEDGSGGKGAVIGGSVVGVILLFGFAAYYFAIAVPARAKEAANAATAGTGGLAGQDAEAQNPVHASA